MECPVCHLMLPGGAEADHCPRCALAGALNMTTTESAPGARLGNYDRLHELGRGAMGVVWLARERGINRLVALKLIPTGSDPMLAQRLQREAQAVARLSHPHIVAVHALGGSGSETFLAMDFLEGGNLEDSMAGAPLAPKAAAILLAKLADAIVHAHAAGILHRDLKPSNVLLTAAGEPMLADFGLAGPLEGRGDLTRADQFAGTPAYLAPEMLGGSRHASPLSDIYGLGAVLYFCLTARPPFVGESVASMLGQLAQVDPVAPRRLQPGIPRDLETICLKCLSKTPSHRYASAQALLDDLQRFRRNEPIAARPIGPWGKAERWCRRHPGAATSVSLAGLIIVALAVGGPVIALRLATSRKAAADAAATATAISNFLETDLLAQASPTNQPDRDLKLRTVLDQAARKIDGRFPDQPLVEAALRQTIGNTYRELGDYPTAKTHLERALVLRLAHAVPGSDRSTLILKPAALTGVLERNKPVLLKLERTELFDLITTIDALGSLTFDMSRLEDAESLLRAAADLARRGLGAEDPGTLRVLNNLAVVLENLRKTAESDALAEEVAALDERRFGAENSDTLTALNNLAERNYRRGNIAQATAILQRVLTIRRKISGPENPETITVMNNLAFMEMLAEKLPDAESLYLQTLELRKRVSGPEHPMTLNTMANLALVYKAEHKLPEAEALDRQAAEIANRVLGPDHTDTIRYESHLANVEVMEGRLAEAEKTLHVAVAASVRNAPKDWQTAFMKSRLGDILIDLGRYEEAEPLLTEGYAGLKQAEAILPPPNKQEVATARARLARLYTKWGKPALAQPWQP